MLRGPQGTLYGRNATGGAVNLKTAKPTSSVEGYARFTVGGPKGILVKPRGLDIDPKHHAIIVSDKQLNAVVTFEMPQIFKATSPANAGR